MVVEPEIIVPDAEDGFVVCDGAVVAALGVGVLEVPEAEPEVPVVGVPEVPEVEFEVDVLVPDGELGDVLTVPVLDEPPALGRAPLPVAPVPADPSPSPLRKSCHQD